MVEVMKTRIAHRRRILGERQRVHPAGGVAPDLVGGFHQFRDVVGRKLKLRAQKFCEVAVLGRMELAVGVLLEKVGASSLSFRILGDGVDGTRYFEGKLVSVFIDFQTRRPIPIPDGIRARAAAYAALHDAE